jgi:iron complex transport system substrate-binding protein
MVSWIILAGLLTACTGGSRSRSGEAETDTVTLRHATLFRIAHQSDYTKVTVCDPWREGTDYARYYLVKDTAVAVPADGVKIRIPLSNLMINSATHIGFLELLGELPRVVGVSDADRIYNATLRAAIDAGRVQRLGDSFNLDIEKLLLLHPDAVMTTAYNADDENSRRMRRTGIPLIYNVEWQEQSVLGRAEWIKFIAAFFDRSELADSLFEEIEQRYDSVRVSVSREGAAPSVMSGQDFRGSWSMPGGQSFGGELLRDAGATYYYSENPSRGSVQVSMEEALLHFGNADVWIGAQAETLAELGQADAKYKLFKAYRTGRVYNYNARMVAGGNDYWESGVARPDLLLSDLMKVLYPDALPDYELTYMHRLE